MRKNPTIVPGWTLITTTSPIVCNERCSTTISQRVGVTEIMVFGITNGNAAPISEQSVFSYK